MSTAAKSVLMALAIDHIVESPDNPRKHFDPAFIDELAKSLAQSGQLTPCIVRPAKGAAGRYELAAGATRLRAARQAKLERLDCLVRPMDDAEFLELLTFENLKRRDLRPLEEARGYAVLQKKLEGWTVEKIAERSGVSPSYVRDRLRLLTLHPDALALVEAGTLPLGHALELAKLTQAQQQEMVGSGGDAFDDDGLWRYEDYNQLGLADDGERDPAAHRSVVPLASLRAEIRDRYPVDLATQQTAELFPELMLAVEDAMGAALPIVQITDRWSAPQAEGSPPILNNEAWRRADGTRGAKKCKHAVQLGVGVHGSPAVFGQAFLVCIAKTECRTHFADEIRIAESRAKWDADRKADAAGKGGKEEEAPWRKQERLKREAIARLKPAKAAILEAIAAKLESVTAKAGGPLDALLLHQRRTIRPEAAKRFPRSGGLEAFVRQLAFDEVLSIFGSEWQLDRFRKVAKGLGVNLDALAKAHAPKGAKAGTGAKTTKAGKAAKAKATKARAR